MKLWEDFHPRVMPYVIGCPTPMVNQALTDAAREFCVTTKAWQETEEFPAFADVSVLDFDKPTGTEVLQVMGVKVDGKPLRVLNHISVPTPEEEGGVNPQTIYRVNEEQYRILPQPSAGQAVSITLALRPMQSGAGVGDTVFEKYVETIAAGARAILQRLPRRDWTDMAQAGIDRAKFDKDMYWIANQPFMQNEPSQHRVRKWG